MWSEAAAVPPEAHGMPLVMDAADVWRRLDVRAAADALQAAFRDGVEVTAPQRTSLAYADATFLAMPAAGMVGGRPLAGAKLVTIRPANGALGRPSVHAGYVLFGGPHAAPVAFVDGAALTELRTSAVSAVATRLLAPADAARLVIFGAGAQARAHLDAMCAVRPVREVVVVGRTAERAEALAAYARSLGVTARTGTAVDVRDADLVCTCTTSTDPLFDGALLRPGTHVNAVGAFQPHTRELDATAVGRARVVVETRDAALAEAGELCIPIAGGTVRPDVIVADLAELCAGAQVRRSAEDITVFKSVGLAMEDLVVAAALLP